MNKQQNNQTVCQSNKKTCLTSEQMFDQLKKELQLAFSAPDSDYQSLTAEDIIQRNKLN